MSEVKIKKIEIKIDKKTLRMTTEQATELQAELNRKFSVFTPAYPTEPIITCDPYWDGYVSADDKNIDLTDFKGIYCTTIIN